MDSSDDIRQEFLQEAGFLIERCEEAYLRLENEADRTESLAEIFRIAHSIKGTAAMIELSDLSVFSHAVEDYLSALRARPDRVDATAVSLLLRATDAIKNYLNRLRAGDDSPWETTELRRELASACAAVAGEEPPAPEDARKTAKPVDDVPAPRADETTVSTAVRIDTSRIENVLNLVGELVVLKSQLLHAERSGDSGSAGRRLILDLIDKTVRELYDRTLSLRMTSMKSLFVRVQRTIRDLTVKLDKPADVHFEGEGTEIDRNMIELLADPLIHIARNALDHGIEPRELRRHRGKPEHATIRLSARGAGGRVILEISDDGGGIAREKVLSKAIKMGLVRGGVDPAALSDRDVYAFMFEQGFTTAERITDISGRGVGLDVVRHNVESLYGEIEVESHPGVGTTFRLSLPLTTSISEGMVVRLGNQPYVLPLNAVRELLRLEETARLPVSDVREGIEIRGQVLPLLSLGDMFPVASDAGAGGDGEAVLVLESRGATAAFRVDAVVGQSQFVIKPLDGELDYLKGFAGSVILGDGKVALVFDVDQILEMGQVHALPR